MGLSGMMGKVYYVADKCPQVDCSTFSMPSDDSVCWEEEVTKFTIVDSVQKKEYGHDKSKGWQDVCTGIRRLGITLDAIVNNGDGVPDGYAQAGEVLYLILYPTGKGCNHEIAGYAVIEQVSYTYDQETGQPISYTATLASKGPWSGLGTDINGGFECECNDNSGA